MSIYQALYPSIQCEWPKCTAYWNDFPLADRKKGKRNGQALHGKSKMNLIRNAKKKITYYIMLPDSQQFNFQHPYVNFYWNTAILIDLHSLYGFFYTTMVELYSLHQTVRPAKPKILSALFLDSKIQEIFKLNLK